MEILLTESVFEQESPYELLTEMQRARTQKHLVLVQDAEGRAYSSWLDACKALIGEELSELLKMQLEQSLLVSSGRKFTVLGHNERPNRASHEVTFRELADILLRSFSIYVENGRADKRFLTCLLDENIRRDLEDLVRMGAVSFENGGGIDEMRMKITEDLRQKDLLRFKALVVFDSDAPEPGAPSRSAVTLTRLCESEGLPYICLGRRAIENYVPLPIIEHYSEQSGNQRIGRLRMSRAFRRLNRDQRAHLHMKNGLSAEQAERALYSSVPEADKQSLSVGFGDDLSSCFNTMSRSSFDTSEADLRAEIEAIAAQVMELL